MVLARAFAAAADSFYRALRESEDADTSAKASLESAVDYLDPDVARERELVEHIYYQHTGKTTRWENLPAEWKRSHIGDDGWALETGRPPSSEEDGHGE